LTYDDRWFDDRKGIQPVKNLCHLSQGDHLPGKPGNCKVVKEKLGKLGKFRGNHNQFLQAREGIVVIHVACGIV